MRTDPDTGEMFLDLSDIPDVTRKGPPHVRDPYNYDRDAASLEAGTTFTQPSLTQQQFAEDADINVIVRRFGLTGQLPENVRLPSYGDFTQVTDYQTALNAVRAAEEAFMALPAATRAEFSNDPQKLLAAVEDPAMLTKLRELGLAKPEQVPPPGRPFDPLSPSERPESSPATAKHATGKKHAEASRAEQPDQSST